MNQAIKDWSLSLFFNWNIIPVNLKLLYFEFHFNNHTRYPYGSKDWGPMASEDWRQAATPADNINDRCAWNWLANRMDKAFL